jgi:hypothetical protein
MSGSQIIFSQYLPERHRKEAEFLAVYSVYCKEMDRYLNRAKPRRKEVVVLPGNLIALWQEVERLMPDWQENTLPIADLQRRYGIPPGTLRRWAANGMVRAVKRGQVWWLSVDDVSEQIRRRQRYQD